MSMLLVVLLWCTVVTYHNDALRCLAMVYVVTCHNDALRRLAMVYVGSIT